MIHEINSHDWPAFCRLVTTQRAGAMVNLEVTGSDGLKTELAANAVLQTMVFNATDGCSDTIIVRVGGTREVIHEIIEPIVIRLYPSGSSGDGHAIHIEAENGITILTLHPAIHPQMLEGLAHSKK